MKWVKGTDRLPETGYYFWREPDALVLDASKKWDGYFRFYWSDTGANWARHNNREWLDESVDDFDDMFNEVDEDVDLAAHDYCTSMAYGKHMRPHIKTAFGAGAEWQQEKTASENKSTPSL